jgi:hypothetical protein
VSKRLPMKKIARNTATGSIRRQVIVNSYAIELRPDWVTGFKNSITQKGCDATTKVSVRPKTKPANGREPLNLNYTRQPAGCFKLQSRPSLFSSARSGQTWFSFHASFLRRVATRS